MPVTIQKMVATFGNLEQAVLTPGSGLTVITAPNEAGKSTWAAFLKAMFYGVDTKERDKAGYLADKNRYQPWSGAPMSGEIQLEWEGREITLRRTSTRTGPMQQFEAFYTASGDPVPGLTGANVGQKLLGIGKEVFTRSALVGQNASTVTAVPELESRIAALATSGEETVSAAATQRTLKDWRNRRRSNRSNGLIPELEAELYAVEQSLRDYELSRSRKDEARRKLDELSERRQHLEQEQELHRKLASKELNRRCGEALARLEDAQAKLSALSPADPAFEGMSAQEAHALAASLQEKAEEQRQLRQQNAQRDQLQRKRNRIKLLFKLMVALFGFGGLAMVIAGFVARIYPVSFWGFGLMMASVALSIVFVLRLGSVDQKLHKLAEQADIQEEDPIPDADQYVRWLTERDTLIREVRHCRERYEDLTAQGAQPLNTLELLPTPVHSPAETAAMLSAAERESSYWQTQMDQAIGALRADPQELESRRAELEAKVKQRTAEYEAIDLALSALEQANSALRERFSPTLNQAAAAIFSDLTGGKYTSLTLSRDFSAMAGGDASHSALYLSAGTVDQLYLSVRLALCNLTVPDTPILLDDALCAFDDRRMEQALEVLIRLGQERQILLFSCHGREAQWANANGIPVITL